ncbi:23S rRNA (adenine(1618)-N(6))-methyltransferase RlmF [Halopseudomonas nanhaiensis]|uniref:23S rRNA (adenine(1618)-N(6))-methyltransferase RlmF n=1 Tax=Halopseudomonas nanhaiensis TaxID=2830842 RepID=UPI001CBACAD3|nr:23S rRNA (adenine(1618)-N(6))-methyltransferase RlmF [Halopseudomonas nanhaiensis]UAW97688.1 23S rRNA (adenine(1618)-N(6))-methyltransferase RlmF [Halopseudomonas nanhaiensis]
MTRSSQQSSRRPSGPHPRNRHQGRYDFDALVRVAPELRAFMRTGVHGQPTLDFANPQAVRALNGALLLTQYGIEQWSIPPGYLCPPVPGRADYVHALADLLADSHDGVVPAGHELLGLDIGTGANLIYPLVGRVEYDWRFIAADIDPAALRNAEQILAANPTLASGISLRLQSDPTAIFEHIIQPDELVDFTLCNPPFHRSADEAHEASRKKWQNLRGTADPALNFGGQHNELFCEDGESGFLQRMANQSGGCREQVFWFSSLVSRLENVAPLQERVRALGATDVRVIPMAQGNKRSRFVAWTFLDKKQRRAWRRARWP